MIIKTIELALICILLNFNLVKCGKYNVSYEMLSKCKEYDAVTGYNYDSYFKINEMKNLRESDDLLCLRLSVLASKDAHILLSATDSPKSDEDVYEIVLGAGSNTFSEIRKKRKTGSLTTVSTKKLLSVIDPLPIVVRVKMTGLITVTIDGELIPLMSAMANKLIAVQYISFSSWGTTVAKWFYDCPAANSDSMTKVERPLSALDKLIKVLFTDYDPYKIPENLEEVIITSMVVKRVTYNIKKSIMETLVELDLSWTDEKLAWEPSKYEKIEEIDSRRIQTAFVWCPTLKLMNGIDLAFVDELDLTMTLHANGTVTAQSRPFLLKTWCSQRQTLKQWPSEKMICEIVLAIGVKNISLVHKSGTTGFDLLSEQSEWSLSNFAKAAVQSDTEILNNFDATYYDDNDQEYSNDSPVAERKLDISFRFYLQRNQQFYEKVFATPLLVAFIMLLLSFWSTGYSRVALTLLATLVLAASFVFITRHAPLSYVPILMQYYQVSLILSWISFTLVIAESWLNKHPPMRSPPTAMAKVAGFSFLRFCLGLETVNIYDCLKQPDMAWRELKNVIDRVVFVCYFIFFVWILIAGY